MAILNGASAPGSIAMSDDALVAVNSTAAQIQLAEEDLNTASEMLQLTQQSKQFGVGVVLEDIQAQEALTQARSDYIRAGRK